MSFGLGFWAQAVNRKQQVRLARMSFIVEGLGLNNANLLLSTTFGKILFVPAPQE